jgi:hypothetical protein
MDLLLTDVYACINLIDKDPFIYNQIIRLSRKFREWTRKNPNYVLEMRQNISIPKRFFSHYSGNGGTIWLHRNSRHLSYDDDYYLYYKEDYNSSKKYKIERDIHRLDKPAIEWDDGVKEYRKYGRLHRKDGPAIEFPDDVPCLGDKDIKKCQGVWFYNGKPHRVGGPVCEGRMPHCFVPCYFGLGYQEYLPFRELCFGPHTIWCENGMLHRIDGPALYSELTGGEQWYIWGKLHRNDGPAVIERRHFPTYARVPGIYHEYYNNGQLTSTIVKDFDDPDKILAVYPIKPEEIYYNKDVLRPPEKLVGFWSKLFNTFKNKTTTTVNFFFNLWLFRILFQPFQKLFTIGN